MFINCIVQGLGSLNQLSSKFYTLIPHNFGRRVPPAINATSIVQKKEMLITLADIELTQNLQKKKVRPKINPSVSIHWQVSSI